MGRAAGAAVLGISAAVGGRRAGPQSGQRGVRSSGCRVEAPAGQCRHVNRSARRAVVALAMRIGIDIDGVLADMAAAVSAAPDGAYSANFWEGLDEIEPGMVKQL